MSNKNWSLRTLGVFLFVASFSGVTLAQYPCQSSYRSGYGGYSNQSLYGQPGFAPHPSAYPGMGYLPMPTYAPLSPYAPYGVTSGYSPYGSSPTQSYYSNSVNYVNPHHSHHHAWHPGHYLLGHH